MLPKKTLLTLLLILFLSGPSKAISVSPTGSNSDQNVINEALKDVSDGAVYLNSGVYEITGPLYIHSGTKLTGSPDVIIRVSSSSSQWFVQSTGIINPADYPLKNVEIYGFQIDGNLGKLSNSFANYGNGDHNAERLIYLMGNKKAYMENISIHDMKLYDSFSDGVQLAYCKNSHVYNNFISNCQHDGIFLICAVQTAVSGNDIAGITSDCLRLDNCVNCTVFNNTFYSYTGDNTNGQGIKGENGIQIADEGYSHGGGSTKPLNTTNIEVWNNTFANTGLRAIWLDSTGKGVTNVYIHDNKFLNGYELETAGIPVYNNISYNNPPTKEMSEKIFSIFDVLNTEFTDSGVTNQTADDIKYTVKETEHGKIAAGLKIVGFKNVINLNNKTYISGPDDCLVKYSVIKNPSLNLWWGDISDVKKDLSVNISNGTATATLKVKVYWYNYKKNARGRVTKDKIHTDSYEFSDSCPAPEVLKQPDKIIGTIYQYPDYFIVSVPSTDQLIKIRYENETDYTEHIFAVGERSTGENGLKSTNFTGLEHWEGNLFHYGNWIPQDGIYDPTKFSVTVFTPYNKTKVTEFNIVKKVPPKEPVKWWFYPKLFFMGCLGIAIRFYRNRIKNL
jgi:hypothetical protein